MSTTQLGKKEEKIRALVASLAKLDAMRPGTLSVQYRNPNERATPRRELGAEQKEPEVARARTLA